MSSFLAIPALHHTHPLPLMIPILINYGPPVRPPHPSRPASVFQRLVPEHGAPIVEPLVTVRVRAVVWFKLVVEAGSVLGVYR